MRLKLSRLLTFGVIFGLAALWNNTSVGQVLAHETSSGAAAPAIVAAAPSCYTWDFLNNTGQDATGLVVHLKGITSLSDVYTGVLNPFGPPDPASGYNSATNVYSLIFSNGTVPDSGMAQIGICANHPALRLDTTQPSFYWVVNGSPADPAPLFAGLDFNWINANHLQVHLYNETSAPLTAFSFTVLTPSGTLSLDDLNGDVASMLPIANDQIADPFDLASGSSATFDVFLDQGGVQVAIGAPIVIEAVLSAQDDPGNTIHLLAQTAQPFALVYLPMLNR